jgi:hypothetical protein
VTTIIAVPEFLACFTGEPRCEPNELLRRQRKPSITPQEQNLRIVRIYGGGGIMGGLKVSVTVVVCPLVILALAVPETIGAFTAFTT